MCTDELKFKFKIQNQKRFIATDTSISSTYIHTGILEQRGLLKQEMLIGPSMGFELN